MAIVGGDTLRITLHQLWYNQQVLNVFHYRVDQGFVGPYSGIDAAREWWNEVKVNWRAWTLDTTNFLLNKVVCEELGGDLTIGEYQIPTAEQRGLRSFTGDLAPTFVAAGVKWIVANRQTRPGSSRFAPLSEADIAPDGSLGGGAQAALTTLAGMLDGQLDIGAADALGLVPIVYGAPENHSGVAVRNDIVGSVVKTVYTSQVSRKIGRGS